MATSANASIRSTVPLGLSQLMQKGLLLMLHFPSVADPYYIIAHSTVAHLRGRSEEHVCHKS